MDANLLHSTQTQWTTRSHIADNGSNILQSLTWKFTSQPFKNRSQAVFSSMSDLNLNSLADQEVAMVTANGVKWGDIETTVFAQQGNIISLAFQLNGNFTNHGDSGGGLFLNGVFVGNLFGKYDPPNKSLYAINPNKTEMLK